MVVEKIAMSAVEIVAKKLVDVLGARADKFFDKDEVRAASYKAYNALRDMEAILKDVENDIDAGVNHPDTPHVIDELRLHLQMLSQQVEVLRAAFADMKIKFEVFYSVEVADFLDTAIGVDEKGVKGMSETLTPAKRRALWRKTKTTVVKAREAIAKFIKANYKIDQKESGR